MEVNSIDHTPLTDHESSLMEYDVEPFDGVVEGPLDYEMFRFMQDWLGGMSEIGESLGAMHPTVPAVCKALTARISSKSIIRPPRTREENQCLTLLVDIGGLKAYTLFDSGSTGEALSPHFTLAAGLKVHTLKKGVNIQLGTVGSRSKINFGTHVTIALGDVNTQHYFDVFNIDKYDAIIGTLSMRQHGIILDLKHNVIRFD